MIKSIKANELSAQVKGGSYLSLTASPFDVTVSTPIRTRMPAIRCMRCNPRGIELILPLSLSLSLWTFSCIKFHSLSHAYMYINDTCKFIFIQRWLSKDYLLDGFL